MKNRDNFKAQLDHWRRRGLVKDIINEDYLLEHFKDQSSTPDFKVYCGIDPTASSLHLGHLVPLKLLHELTKFGITPIILIGEATALIGDPSFRLKRRKSLSSNEIGQNTKLIKEQIKQLIPNAIIISNMKWYQKFSILQFMEKIGTLFSVKYMLQKKAFADALKQDNLAYSNFSYILMQAYDFYHLYSNENCLVQIGGSDQYPNIAFGVKAINRISNSFEILTEEVPDWTEIKNSGITTNLLTNKSGSKISKTTENSIWLDSSQTSIFEMFQHLYNLDDHVAEQWLKIFDLTISDADLEKLMIPEVKKNRTLQKKLFQVISQWIYNADEIKNFQAHNLEEIAQLLEEKNPQEIAKFKKYLTPVWMIFTKPINFISLLIEIKVVTSASQALKLLAQKGIRINFKVVTDPHLMLKKSDFVNDYLLIQKGKQFLRLIDIGESIQWIYNTGEIKNFQAHDLEEVTRLLKEKNPQEIEKFKKYLTPTWMIFTSPISLIELLIDIKIVTSTSQALKLLTQKEIKINFKVVTDSHLMLKKSDFVNGYLLIQKGKRFLQLIDIGGSIKNS